MSGSTGRRSHDASQRREEKALTNPSSVFKVPLDVASCAEFSRKEKAEILKQWELDARLLQVATEEGMSEGERSLFSDVKKAQDMLGAEALEGGWRADEARAVTRTRSSERVRCYFRFQASAIQPPQGKEPA